jgi:hypothetical protein
VSYTTSAQLRQHFKGHFPEGFPFTAQNSFNDRESNSDEDSEPKVKRSDFDETASESRKFEAGAESRLSVEGVSEGENEPEEKCGSVSPDRQLFAEGHPAVADPKKHQ